MKRGHYHHRAILGKFVQVNVIVPAVGAVLATLLGVALGSLLTRRVQAEQWSRDRQVDACLSILRESTRTQIILRRLTRNEVEKLDWSTWNEAVAVINLVGHRDMVSAAFGMDAAFWRSNESIERGEIGNDEAWAAIRDDMEASRLAFINAARRHLWRSDEPPILHLLARPSSSEVGTTQSRSPSGEVT